MVSKINQKFVCLDEIQNKTQALLYYTTDLFIHQLKHIFIGTINIQFDKTENHLIRGDIFINHSEFHHSNFNSYLSCKCDFVFLFCQIFLNE